MSESQLKPWSNTLQRSHTISILGVYSAEALLGSILYGMCQWQARPPAHLPIDTHFVRSILGIVIVLFF